MNKDQIAQVLDTAETKWEQAGAKDMFTTRLKVPDDPNETEVNVQIYHHETFPLGGRTYTADLRSLPPEGKTVAEGHLIKRHRFHRV